jgi:hypothetical protein
MWLPSYQTQRLIPKPENRQNDLHLQMPVRSRCGMEMNKAASIGGLFQFTNVSCWHTHSRRDRNRLRCLRLKVKQTLATGSDLPEVGLRGCERASRAMSRPLTGLCHNS